MPLPVTVILIVFGVLFSTCVWAYVKEKRGGRGSVTSRDVVVFIVRVIVYGGGLLLLIFAILIIQHYAGGGH